MKPDRRCVTCAFRPGTEASETPETMAMVRLCVIAREEFDCHEADRPCVGWLAAVVAARPESTENRKQAASRLAKLRDLRDAPFFGVRDESRDREVLGEIANWLDRRPT